ncbi:winged helix-turn-helix transcriptional regulator [Desulfohalobiaceae bacterium Ax17]|uniref:siroheme decarboxylase subunit beta n=1 Tax=Desulfovulcanus ferrireducens TaxID=2831190 RepID=UPI00207BA0E5|nr:winged helix-turn-helix transcriptional regulator [Desulfovulcanus ferrireducens]MBT8762609.1 winged helix-turn-helix transcriptional regulator [Desulfovulcanus ferrireducens]
MTYSIELTPKQKEILKIIQADLPDSATPFAEIAKQTGSSEEEVLNLLTKLKNEGYIRRFGATLRHQQAGYEHNAMVAWYVEEDHDIDQVGRIMASKPEITHCYERINCLDWPYNLYTMIHGQSEEDCLRVISELVKETGVTQYEILFSYKELKKTSMEYF